MSLNNKKPKHKAKSFKKMSDIEKVDDKTFYVKSSQPDKEPYMVFNSINIGWTCDCLSFVYNIDDAQRSKDCKHITLIKKTYSLE